MLLAGCGGADSSPEDKARSAVNDFFAAVDDKDGKRACEQMIPRAQLDFVEPLILGGGTGDISGKGDPCGAVIDALSAETRRQLKKIGDAEIEDVDVAGDRATVLTGAGKYGIEERNGDYKLADIPNLIDVAERAETEDPRCVKSPGLPGCKTGTDTGESEEPPTPPNTETNRDATKALTNILKGFSNVEDVTVRANGEATVTVSSKADLEAICTATRVPDGVSSARVEDPDGIELSNCAF